MDCFSDFSLSNQILTKMRRETSIDLGLERDLYATCRAGLTVDADCTLGRSWVDNVLPEGFNSLMRLEGCNSRKSRGRRVLSKKIASSAKTGPALVRQSESKGRGAQFVGF